MSIFDGVDFLPYNVWRNGVGIRTPFRRWIINEDLYAQERQLDSIWYLGYDPDKITLEDIAEMGFVLPEEVTSQQGNARRMAESYVLYMIQDMMWNAITTSNWQARIRMEEDLEED